MARINYAARTLLSFATFNVGWWGCALGASRGWPWLGPAMLPILAGLHLYFAPVAKGEAVFLVALGFIGFAIDTAFLHAGLFSVNAFTGVAPMWLISMWILLGMTFESMLMMRRNRWLMLLSGAMSGPLSYYCCEAVHVLHYARPLWVSLPLHAAVWALLLPVLFRVRDYALLGVMGAAEASALAADSQQARFRQQGLHLVESSDLGKFESAPPEH